MSETHNGRIQFHRIAASFKTNRLAFDMMHVRLTLIRPIDSCRLKRQWGLTQDSRVEHIEERQGEPVMSGLNRRAAYVIDTRGWTSAESRT